MTDVNDIMTDFSSFSLITPLSTRRGVGGEATPLLYFPSVIDRWFGEAGSLHSSPFGEVGWGYFTITNTFSPFSIASVILRINCWTHFVESST